MSRRPAPARGAGASASKPIRAPRARSCYICGRMYMTHSFHIHEVQCIEMFEKWEAQKPPKERRRVPQDHMNMEMGQGVGQGMGSSSIVKRGVHKSGSGKESGAFETDNRPLGRQSTGRGEEVYVNAMSGNLQQCRSCGRTFNGPSYAKHVLICAKLNRPRKVFDSAKQRAEGTDLGEYREYSQHSAQMKQKRSGGGVKGMSGGGVGGTGRAVTGLGARTGAGGGTGGVGGMGGTGVQPKWKQDSLLFRSAMKSARMVSQAEAKSKATGVPLHVLLSRGGGGSRGGGAGGVGGGGLGGYAGGGGGGYAGSGSGEYEDAYALKCPTCLRVFSQQAGERHIPQCSSIMGKPSRLIRRSGVPSHSTMGESMGGIGGGGVSFGPGSRPGSSVSGSETGAGAGYGSGSGAGYGYGARPGPGSGYKSESGAGAFSSAPRVLSGSTALRKSAPVRAGSRGGGDGGDGGGFGGKVSSGGGGGGGRFDSSAASGMGIGGGGSTSSRSQVGGYNSPAAPKGGYQIMTSNTTSPDNPLIPRRSYP